MRRFHPTTILAHAPEGGPGRTATLILTNVHLTPAKTVRGAWSQAVQQANFTEGDIPVSFKELHRERMLKITSGCTNESTTSMKRLPRSRRPTLAHIPGTATTRRQAGTMKVHGHMWSLTITNVSVQTALAGQMGTL